MTFDSHSDGLAGDGGGRLPPEPAPAPRALSPAARRGSWTERRVRPWWMLGLALLAIACYYAVSRVYTWSQERTLITSGRQVMAEVMGWEVGGDAPKNKVLPADAGVDLQYTVDGRTYRPHGTLAGRKEQIYTRTRVPIYIDPADPTRWTARAAPGSLAQELLSAGLLVPFIVVLFAAALWSRGRVLRIYRDGEAVLGEVVGLGHSAAAPLSLLVRCAVHGGGGGEARVIKAILPARKAPAAEGEPIWLISPPGRPELGIPAVLFE